MDRAVRISRPKTQFIDFTFGQDNDLGRLGIPSGWCDVGGNWNAG